MHWPNRSGLSSRRLTSQDATELWLGQVPMFSTTPLHGSAAPKSLFVPSTATRRQLIAEGGAYLQVVGQFNVVESAAKVVAAPKVYLRVDDKLPQDARLVGGVQDQPLTFSWRIGDEFKGDKSKVVFRYQLSPADDDWGAWGPATESSYTFVQKGVFSFRVQARYGEGANAVISQPASFQGTLPRDLIARPTKEALTKSPVGVVPILQPPIAFDTVYAKSRALLIGMWEFDDYRNFQRFDGVKISADLVALEQALRINGFDQVTVLKRARITKEEIEAAMADLVDAAGKDDRIFVYFSTHGFADEIVSSEGYLATSDCKMAQPTVRCLRLNDLQARVIDRALDGKHARQMLIAVDSCFAGLGIVRKSSASADLTRLAVPQGAFMLTAGMAAQTAQIDPQLGMSTFTYFLSEGLKGKADVLGNNGVITLTELFLYVQYEVARRTDSQQIPMLGRMKGDGEMLFRPVAATTPPAK